MLQTKIDHDDRKPLGRWLVSQDNYARLEVEKLLATPVNAMRVQDRLRLWMVLAPWVTLVYCLLVKRLLLDGWRGLHYTLQRVVAEVILSLRLLEQRFKAG